MVFPLSEKWFSVRRLNRAVWAIREPHHEEDVLSYLVVGTHTKVLVDCGVGLADITKAVDADADTLVLLTHSHWDHVGGCRSFKTVFAMDDDYEQSRLRRGWLPREIVGYERANFDDAFNYPPSFRPERIAIPPVNGARALRDGERIGLGGIELQTIHTPGHTPGSVCYFLEPLGMLFTGDSVYPGPIYLHLEESSFTNYQRSLDKLHAITRHRLQRILPGHNAFSCSPSLLSGHVAAAKGEIAPSHVEDSEDSFGPFTQSSWRRFSFLVSRRG